VRKVDSSWAKGGSARFEDYLLRETIRRDGPLRPLKIPPIAVMEKRYRGQDFWEKEGSGKRKSGIPTRGGGGGVVGGGGFLGGGGGGGGGLGGVGLESRSFTKGWDMDLERSGSLTQMVN